jgi:predicted cobalt transporter CbtA
MVRALLVRGMIAGLCAGVIAAGFAEVVGEPQVDRAITFEAAHADAAEPHHHDPVSRTVQKTAGLFTALAVYGASFGGLFALAFAVVFGRVGRLRALPTAVWLAGAVFVAVVLVPFLKYPANPPAVGNPDTIGSRTGLYFSMIAISVLSAVAALRLARQAAARWGETAGPLVGAGAFLVLVVAAGVALPAVDEVPRDFPAATLWHFRMASLGTQLVLWSSLGLLFGAAAQRALGRHR